MVPRAETFSFSALIEGWSFKAKQAIFMSTGAVKKKVLVNMNKGNEFLMSACRKNSAVVGIEVQRFLTENSRKFQIKSLSSK